MNEPRCEFSGMIEDQCAHCRLHMVILPDPVVPESEWGR